MARAPVPIRLKLVVAFGSIVALLVMTAAIGGHVLAQSTRRTETMATLQRQVSVYRQLQSAIMFKLYIGATVSTGSNPVALGAAERQLRESYDFERLEFLARNEGPLLTEIRDAYNEFVSVTTTAIDFERGGRLAEAQELRRQARPVADTLVRLTDGLVNKAESDITTLARENQEASGASRRAFIAFAVAGIAVALVLSFVISSSIIAPITLMNRRLGQLASGDFTQRVDLANRDELGVLAANINAMSDELGRLYDQLAEWNRNLEARVAEQVQELRESRARVVAAADTARRRIERDLHDGAQQQLVALAVNLRLARDLVHEDPGVATEMLEGLAGGLKDALAELRDLAHGIYPPLLVDSGLAEALRAAAARSSLDVRLKTARVGRYPGETEAAVYFCCVEALQNAAKHAPGSCVKITLRDDVEGLAFEVTDDGPGFDPQAELGGHGFVNMRDRLGAVGGRVHWASAPGEGTRVWGIVPIDV